MKILIIAILLVFTTTTRPPGEGVFIKSEQTRIPLLAAYKMIDRDNATLDLNLTDRVAMVDALVLAGVFSAANKVSLFALGTIKISVLELNGLGSSTPADINIARS